MGVDFSPDRWLKVKETYRQWWTGELDRPILPVILDGRDPGLNITFHIYTSNDLPMKLAFVKREGGENRQ